MNPLAAAVAHPRSAAVLGALAIAFSGIFYVASDVSPSTGVFFRCLYGLPILVLVAWAERRALGPMSRRAVVLCTIAGVCFAADLITFHYAVDVIGAGLGTVMGNVQVVIVAIVAWLVFGERPRREVIVAIPVMLIGVVLISGIVGSGAYGVQPGARRPDRADHGGLVRGLPPDHPARDAGPAAGGARSRSRRPSPRCARSCSGSRSATSTSGRRCRRRRTCIALGILSQSIGYLAIQVSLPRLPAVITSVLLLVQPVTTVFLGAILLRELPSPFQLAGVGLVIVRHRARDGQPRRRSGTRS